MVITLKLDEKPKRFKEYARCDAQKAPGAVKV